MSVTGSRFREGETTFTSIKKCAQEIVKLAVGRTQCNFQNGGDMYMMDQRHQN